MRVNVVCDDSNLSRLDAPPRCHRDNYIICGYEIIVQGQKLIRTLFETKTAIFLAFIALPTLYTRRQG